MCNRRRPPNRHGEAKRGRFLLTGASKSRHCRWQPVACATPSTGATEACVRHSSSPCQPGSPREPLCIAATAVPSERWLGARGHSLDSTVATQSTRGPRWHFNITTIVIIIRLIHVSARSATCLVSEGSKEKGKKKNRTHNRWCRFVYRFCVIYLLTPDYWICSLMAALFPICTALTFQMDL